MNLCSWWRAALREAAVGPARWGRAAGAPRGSSSSSTAPTAAPWTAPVRAARGDNGSADNGSALCRAARGGRKARRALRSPSSSGCSVKSARGVLLVSPSLEEMVIWKVKRIEGVGVFSPSATDRPVSQNYWFSFPRPKSIIQPRCVDCAGECGACSVFI